MTSDTPAPCPSKGKRKFPNRETAGGHLPPFVSGHPVVGIAAGLLLFLGKPGSQSRFSGVLTALARRPCTHGNQWQIG